MNYPYANGIIKAKENKIFDKNQFSKLIKTDKLDFIKTLIDMGYAEASAGDSLEVLINDELVNTKKLLDEITPNKKFTDLFFFSYDALNIKALYKMKIFGIHHLNIFVDTGTISEEALKKAILEGDNSGLSVENTKLLNKVNDRIKNNNNPRLVSANIDNCIFEHIFDKLKFSFNESLTRYYKAFIDFVNIITMIRCKKLSWTYEQFKEMFIHGGTVPENDFSVAYNSQNEGIIRVFRDYYSEKISKGLKIYFEKSDTNFLESYFDMLLISVMKEYQNDSFGIGPIICYFLKKQAEAKNIRIIYSGNGTDTDGLIEY